MRRAISPVIATVILIAVTIVIGIAVAGWLMGVWGGFGGGESLQIYPNSTLISANPDGSGAANLSLFVFNKGGSDARIVEIKVGDKKCGVSELVKSGEKKKVGCTINESSGIVPGTMYDVTVMTEAGNLYTIKLVARAK